MVVTHLNVASNMVSAVERLVGRLPAVVGVDLQVDESLENLRDKIAASLSECRKNCPEPVDGFVIMTDLFGSTPTNAALSQVTVPGVQVEILTGVNMPMLVSALVNRSRMLLPDLVRKIGADGVKGIQDAKAVLLARMGGR